MFTLAEPTYSIRRPKNSTEWETIKKLLLDYRHEFDDDTCFTSFEAELANIENYYAEDGMLKLIAVSDDDGSIAGCVAFKTFATGICEMKRLYVRDAFRGMGLGRQLVEATLDAARQAGYACVLLDTLDDMEAARALYEDLGFEDIPPYYHNPIPGAHYLKAALR